MAYSTWNKCPSGEKTVIARSYPDIGERCKHGKIMNQRGDKEYMKKRLVLR
jgi:hypothetical protein